MLASVPDLDNLHVSARQLSRFLSWHRRNGTDGFSSPLQALWIDAGRAPADLPPVREAVGVSGMWTVYRFEDDTISRHHLQKALSGASREPYGRFVPVLPHDLPTADLLRALSDFVGEYPYSSPGYLLQNRQTGQLLTATEHIYPVRPLL